jgi:23S rRNA-/tRNA-specific pseudouridylate synthase
MTFLSDDTPAVISITDRWLALYKPAGWLTIPGTPTGRSSVEESPTPKPGKILSEWARENYEQAWVVHRLDRETSGVVLFARTENDHRTANQWFQEHRMKKNYDCLAVGIPKAPVLRVKRPVGGAPSVSQVEIKESYREGFLARVTPLTGRRHQIRIHLAGEGHPLWGDVKYGGPASVSVGQQELAVTRVALHAARLELPTREVFEASWPADFQSWVETLRKGESRV